LDAYSEICKKAKPVTARSLKESLSSLPKASIKRWSVVVWILLPILVLLSAIGYANSRFTKNAEDLISYSYDVEKPNFVPSVPANAPTALPGQPSPKIAPAWAEGSPEAKQAQIDAIKETTAQLLGNGYILSRMSLSEQILAKGTSLEDILESKEAGTSELDKRIHELRNVRALVKVVLGIDYTVYGILNTYILPLLCALLGAAAYGLRALSGQALTRTYLSSYAAYARAILAVIVGFAVGLFSEFTAKLSLQPLGAAFLAGYAVEAFFMFLDTILQALQKPRAAPTSTLV
jgi:hypothetical protein